MFPCNECAKAIIQAGIKTIVYDSDKYADAPSTRASKMMLDAAGVRYYQYQHTGRKVELQDRTDARMLGGFKLEFDHNMYDARIRTKIRKLRREFARNDYESKL